MLATTTLATNEWEPWHRPVTSPAIWTRDWGKGRVFVCTPGHDMDVVRNPNVTTIIRAGNAVGGPMRVGIVGAGNISAQYSASLARLPQLQVTAVCDLQHERAAGARCPARRRPGARPAGPARGRRRRRRARAHAARHARRRRAGCARRRQARLRGEAAGNVGGRGPRGRQGGRRGRAAGRLRAGHGARHRRPDRPRRGRRRPDRHPALGNRVHDHPRPRTLAPRPGVLLPARRRSAARHGALLPDVAGAPARPGRAGDRRVLPPVRHPHHRLGHEGGHVLRRRPSTRRSPGSSSTRPARCPR